MSEFCAAGSGAQLRPWYLAPNRRKIRNGGASASNRWSQPKKPCMLNGPQSYSKHNLISVGLKTDGLRFTTPPPAFPWSKGSPFTKTGQALSMAALNEALSDADTQEPVKTELQSRQIPESDDDDDVIMIGVKSSEKTSGKKSNEAKSTGKASRAAHTIADSDLSDDEQHADPPVDFGEEEDDEEDHTTEKSKPGVPVRSKDPDLDDFDDEDKPADKSSKADESEPKPNENAKKGIPASQSPKKTKKAKTKELSPSKTIRKPKVDLKTKSKTVKGKQKGSKKATQVGKTKEKASSLSKSPSLESTAKPTKQEHQSKNSAKSKPLVRKAALPKGDKATLATQKPLKVKKSISKEEAVKEKKSPVKKNTKTAPVSTYSKKAMKASGHPSKTPAKEKKKRGEAVVAQKKSPGRKVVKKTKAVKKKKDEEDEESETTGHVEEEAEIGEPISDSDSMADELATTPSSKLAILGNLACSSRDQNAEALLDHAVQQLGRYHIVSYNAESNTELKAYIIGKGTKRGWGLLQALVSGVPLVSENWLSGSISEGKWLPMNAFRSDKFGHSPRTVEGTEEARGKLLDGLRIRVVSTEKDVASIRKIIRLCGARLAETRVDLVINDSKKKVDTCPNVQKKWLADSIEAGVPLDYEPYLLG
eukprot:TRINITY_DN70969_c0_g1_i1.p1 TRINITY_DN70969_c0_g1~~TRINITY_DN70969_c0_g1_i1.p1  ORF type:complete len:648 (-),score=134.31 TRINITY_DN70969_c0_g1_i1:456-2399(-)